METQANKGYQQSIEIPKPILYTGKILQWVSDDFAALYGMRLFATPLRHKMPKREFEMNKRSKQTVVKLPDSDKEIVFIRIRQ